MKDLYKHYKNVINWNEKCNVRDFEYDTFEWTKSIELQADLIAEEALEIQEASKYSDKAELLKETVDCFVVLSKLMDMLDKAGFDVEGAIEAVQENNDKKVYGSFYEAVEAKEALESKTDEEFFIDTGIHNGLPYYSVKKMTGKVAKAIDFIPVDLSEYLP